MRRQKAELLVSLEVLMSDEDKNNEEYFPRWIFWYRPAERQDEDTSDENGVINGVQRMLAQQSKEQQGMLDQQSKEHQGMLDQQSKDQAVQIANLTQELGELPTAAQLKEERSEHETRIQDMGAKMEKELSELQSQMDKLQQNVSEKIEKANESMQAEMSAKFDLLLAAVAQQVPAPEPEVTPSRDTA